MPSSRLRRPRGPVAARPPNCSAAISRDRRRARRAVRAASRASACRGRDRERLRLARVGAGRGGAAGFALVGRLAGLGRCAGSHANRFANQDLPGSSSFHPASASMAASRWPPRHRLHRRGPGGRPLLRRRLRQDDRPGAAGHDGEARLAALSAPFDLGRPRQTVIGRRSRAGASAARRSHRRRDGPRRWPSGPSALAGVAGPGPAVVHRRRRRDGRSRRESLVFLAEASGVAVPERGMDGPRPVGVRTARRRAGLALAAMADPEERDRPSHREERERHAAGTDRPVGAVGAGCGPW